MTPSQENTGSGTEQDFSAPGDSKAKLKAAIKNEQFEDALHILDRDLISVSPTFGNFYQRARILARLNRPEEATKDYRKAIELNPDAAKVRNELGRVLYRQGQFSDAVEQLEQASAIDPGMVDSELIAAARQRSRIQAADRRKQERAGADHSGVVQAYVEFARANSDKEFPRTVTTIDPIDKGDSKTSHTKEVYEDHWGKRLEQVTNKVGAGEQIGQIIRSIRPFPHAIVQRNRVSSALTDHFAGAYPDLTNAARVARVGVVDSRYTVTENIDPMILIQHSARKARNIVELGAGPGWNLFDLFLMFGSNNADRHYFALEYTEAGIDISRALAKSCGDINFSAAFFDYTKPDLSKVPDDGPTLIFSHHSIEQVEEISPDLYEQILDRKSPTELLHFEPIGWQRYPALLEARMTGDLGIFRAMVEARMDVLDSDIGVVVNAAINSWRTGYNRNCLSIIGELEEAGRVTVGERIYDFTSRMNTNPVNPTTFLRIAAA